MFILIINKTEIERLLYANYGTMEIYLFACDEAVLCKSFDFITDLACRIAFILTISKTFHYAKCLCLKSL